MQVKVKTYRNTSQANSDAKRMAAEGWVPQGMAGGGTRFAPGKGIVDKGLATAFLGPVGLFASSRKEIPVTVTWTRSPEAAAAAAQRRRARQVAKAGGQAEITRMVAKLEAGQSLTFRETRLLPKDDLSKVRRRLKEAKKGNVAGVPANSEKERIAKALEQQNREAQRQGSGAAALENQVQMNPPAPAPKIEPKVSTVELVEELAKAGGLHQQGLITDAEFATIKDRLMNEASPSVNEASAPVTPDPIPAPRTLTPRTKEEKQAAHDRQLLQDADEGWRSGKVLTPKGKRKVATLRQGQEDTTAAEEPGQSSKGSLASDRTQPPGTRLSNKENRKLKQAASDRIVLSKIEQGKRGLFIPLPQRKRLAALRQAQVDATPAEGIEGEGPPRPGSDGT